MAALVYSILMRNFFRNLFVFLSIAFALNFVWEATQGFFLYQFLNILTPAQYVQLILNAALKDMFGLGILFVGIGLYFRDLLWTTKLSPIKYRAILVTTLVLSLLLEVQGVFVFHKWSYTALMPTLAGIGLVPVIQLPLIMLFTVLCVANLKTGDSR